MALTREQWKAHLGVTGWHHEDGTACPTTLAPAKHERLWCTEHQQFVVRPPCERCGGHCTNGAECAVNQFLGKVWAWHDGKIVSTASLAKRQGER